MITISCCGTSINCASAIKGDTFIHLLDENDNIVAVYEGITDFSRFTISGGSWTEAESENDCNLVVMRSDGTIAKVSKKLCDV